MGYCLPVETASLVGAWRCSGLPGTSSRKRLFDYRATILFTVGFPGRLTTHAHCAAPGCFTRRFVHGRQELRFLRRQAASKRFAPTWNEERTPGLDGSSTVFKGKSPVEVETMRRRTCPKSNAARQPWGRDVEVLPRMELRAARKHHYRAGPIPPVALRASPRGRWPAGFTA